jgi:hypothetical protein
MDVLGLSSYAQRGDDEYYQEQWHLYYAERRRLLTRMFWIASVLAPVFLLQSVINNHQLLAAILAVPVVILMFALAAQWFMYGWKIGGWSCPRCGEPFFISTFVRNPLGRSCRHCGLVRPNESEIDHFHYQDERSRPQVPGG